MRSSSPDLTPHYATLKTRLESLRSVFPSGIRAEVYCSLFNDFLASHEFGLALEVLCDCLLEQDVPPISEFDLREIAALHALMEVQDQCFLRLRQKREDFVRTNERQ